MGDMADDFRGMQEHGRQQRKASRARNTELIQQFARDYPNVAVQELTEYHFRIASFLDVFPTRQRFHNLTTGKRGFYVTIPQVYEEQRDKAREALAG